MEQKYALDIIINGIRPTRFEHLRMKYNTLLIESASLDYWAVLKAYHTVDRINSKLPSTDPRSPEYTGSSPTVPVNAALPKSYKRQDGTRRSTAGKRVFDPCTWGPCEDKTSHPTHRCWTKHPELFRNRSGPSQVPANFSVPTNMTRKQIASFQAQLDSFAVQK